jgi:hypothetical protein
MKCPSCEKEHDGYGLPPSLKGKMKICVKCYKELKKKSDNKWRHKHPEKIKKYSRLKEAALKEDLGRDLYLRYNNLRWKIRSTYYKLKHCKTLNTEIKLRRTLNELKADLIDMKKQQS